MRFSLLTVLLLCGALSASAQDTSLTAVEEAFEQANIASTLHITFEPSVLLEVTFDPPSGDSVTIHAGQQIPRNVTFVPPQFAVRGAIPPTQRFVVAAVDPDAPTPQDPVLAQLRHLLAGNLVPGATTGSEQTELVSDTPPLSGWIQPTPSPGSPAHRYVFLLFEQPADFNSQTVLTPITPIVNFNISAFAEAIGLGNPIAGSFMLVAPGPAF